MFARFNENQAMTLQDIKEAKCYGRTHGRTHRQREGRMDGRTDNVKTVYPLQTKFAGGIIMQSTVKLTFLSFTFKSEVRSRSEMFVITKRTNQVLFCLGYLVKIK